MKKFIKKISIVMAASLLILTASCDELSQLTLNVPLPIDFYTSGSNTTLTESEYFCLSQYEEWRDNQDDVESVKFLAASYWTLSATPNLRGNISFTLYDDANNLLFTLNLGTITAANYLEDPFVLQLTENQIQALDSYLMNLSDQNKCFNATLSVTNVTGDTNIQGEYELIGRVEIVLETEVNVN